MSTYRLAGFATGIWLCMGSAFAADSVPAYVTAAIAHNGRPHSEILRDGALQTAGVLAFSGVKPGMAVAELMPETGYYSRILAALVGDKGAVYDIVPFGGGDNAEARRGPPIKDPNQVKPLSRLDMALSVENQPEFKNITVYWEPLNTMFAVPKQLDVVLTANDYHVLKGAEFAKLDMAVVNKNIFETMKNGGTYLVLDNAAAKGTGFGGASALNRVDSDAVKAEILSAGFLFDGESNLLARADDDHSKAASDNAPADMFILRFKKPANAPNSDKRPPDPVAALSGYFGNTRRGNVGAKQERRVMYHADLSYEEYGALGQGMSPFQSGVVFYRADGQGCMLHLFPADERGEVFCSTGRAVPYKKAGDKWNGADDNRPYELVKGYLYFDE